MVALVRPPPPPIFARISYNDAYIPPPWPAAAPFGQRHARPAEHKTTLYNMRSGGRTAAGLCWFRAARPRRCWPRFGLRTSSARVNAARSFLPFSPAWAFRCAAAACAGDARTRPPRRRLSLALFFLPGPRGARRIKGLQPARRPPCGERSRFRVLPTWYKSTRMGQSLRTRYKCSADNKKTAPGKRQGPFYCSSFNVLAGFRRVGLKSRR